MFSISLEGGQKCNLSLNNSRLMLYKWQYKKLLKKLKIVNKMMLLCKLLNLRRAAIGTRLPILQKTKPKLSSKSRCNQYNLWFH